MKFAIDFNHKDFFQKYQMIEFDNFIPAPQLKKWHDSVNSALELKASASPRRLNSNSLFLAGRDLWRVNGELYKLAANAQIAKIAAELTEQKNLRLAYDSYLPVFNESLADSFREPSIYQNYLNKSMSLAELSCIQGVLCGVLICLEAEPQDQVPESPISIFSSKPGNVVFFKPEHIIDFKHLKEKKDGAYLLIVYASLNSVYIYNNNDPLSYMLKKEGYIYGDRLKDKTNPVIYRS